MSNHRLRTPHQPGDVVAVLNDRGYIGTTTVLGVEYRGLQQGWEFRCHDDMIVSERDIFSVTELAEKLRDSNLRAEALQDENRQLERALAEARR